MIDEPIANDDNDRMSPARNAFNAMGAAVSTTVEKENLAAEKETTRTVRIIGCV